MSIILIILLAIIIVYFMNNNLIIEGYDARYSDMDINTCAEFCKTTAGCYGFGYDKEKKICYPSKSIIVGKPLNSIFKNYFSYDNAVCNKVEPINEATKNPSFEKRRANSLFVCSDGQNKYPKYYLHNGGTFVDIGAGKNIDDIFDIENYDVKPYNWPNNRLDYDQIDLLIKERENQTFIPENITDMNKLETPLTKDIDKKIPNKQYELDFNINETKNKLVDTWNKIKSKINVPDFESTKDQLNYKTLSNKILYITYKEIPEINNGQYLNDYKCVKNIPLKNCLNYCSKNNYCVGVEWNPDYDNNANVCCPYKTIGEYMDRTTNKKLGKFYEKQLVSELNKNKTYIS